MEYETGRVLEILSDSCEPDAKRMAHTEGPEPPGGCDIGPISGADPFDVNAVGPLYGEPAASGAHVTLLISTYADGSHNATVYEHDRA